MVLINAQSKRSGSLQAAARLLCVDLDSCVDLDVVLTPQREKMGLFDETMSIFAISPLDKPTKMPRVRVVGQR
jgi:hypothetical protein